VKMAFPAFSWNRVARNTNMWPWRCEVSEECRASRDDMSLLARRRYAVVIDVLDTVHHLNFKNTRRFGGYIFVFRMSEERGESILVGPLQTAPTPTWSVGDNLI
jgi:hypothetical protein